METIKIGLGGKEYEVKALPLRKNREWRQKHGQVLDVALGALEEVKGLVSTVFEDTTKLGLALLPTIVARGPELIRIALKSSDLIVEALFDYSEVLTADKKFIEENATEAEAFTAFVEVLKIAYPFMSILTPLKTLGQVTPTTSENLPAPSGENGTTS